jgi:hypothetical protein
MLLTLASLVLLQVPPDGVLTLELGEQRRLKLPGYPRRVRDRSPPPPSRGAT